MAKVEFVPESKLRVSLAERGDIEERVRDMMQLMTTGKVLHLPAEDPYVAIFEVDLIPGIDPDAIPEKINQAIRGETMNHMTLKPNPEYL
jgi:hypothetical protein